MRRPNPHSRILFWAIFVGSCLLFLWWSIPDSTREISVAELYQAIDKGQIKELNINPSDRQVTGKFENGEKFKAYVVDVGELEKFALSKGVSLKAAPPPASFWSFILSFIPFVILFFVFIWLTRRSTSGLGGPGWQGAQIKSNVERRVGTTFDDVAGCDEVKEEVMEIVDFLKNPLKYRRLGAKIPKGILLVGAPGTGKTLMARAIAGEAQAAFLAVSGSHFVELFVGMGASRVRALFQQAKQNAPCIIFIDEIDAVGRARGLSSLTHDEREQTLNQLLAEMDGFEQETGVIIVAATNRPEILDPALLRSGRFDRRLVMPIPDLKGREAILKVHARKIVLATEVNLTKIAQATTGFTGADLATIVNEAATLATRADREAVTQKDFEEAIDKVLLGPARKTAIFQKEKELTAYHETGHALVIKYTPGADPLRKVTIIPRGLSGGATHALPAYERHIFTKEYLLGRLVICMAGRAAEMIVLKEESSGAQADFKEATRVAMTMVTQYGMSEKIGRAVFAEKSEFLGISGSLDCAPKTRKAIDDEVIRLLDEAYKAASKILEEHRAELEILAKALLEKETLGDEEVEKILKSSK